MNRIQINRCENEQKLSQLSFHHDELSFSYYSIRLII